MAVPTLSGEQLEEIRTFMLSEAAELLFTTMEHGVISDWINCADAANRDECWRTLQSILHLKFSLRDAAAMKKLTDRNQERRVYQS